ncbi:hypothetical protein SLP22_0077 [Salmonella phage BAU.Micro_SLP-22]
MFDTCRVCHIHLRSQTGKGENLPDKTKNSEATKCRSMKLTP